MTSDNDRQRLPWRRTAPYAATILLSSFLLFQIQPMFAKVILPWFGGSSGVWAACMLFFQTALLLGYLYAHWSVCHLSRRAHVVVHLSLLLACSLLIPVSPSAAWRSTGGGDPTLRILGLLLVNIGLPYLALASTSPLIQAWYAREFQGAAPYRLFALSNAGSALALLTYPVLVEPFLALRVQTAAWSYGFAAFAFCCAVTGWLSFRATGEFHPQDGAGPGREPHRPRVADILTWTSLAGCASVLLLAVTNFLTRNVAPAPFLWIIPLFLYLLSFILCFDSDKWYRRCFFLAIVPVAVFQIAYFLWSEAPKTELWWSIGACSASLFVCCMACHGELNRLRPSPRHLTSYFLSIAAGGAAGGIFVGIAAPRLFPMDVELHAGLALTIALAAVRVWNDPPPALAARRGWMRVALLALPVGLSLFLAFALNREVAGNSFLARNFYGSLRINDRTAQGYRYREFVHGSINHGEQWFDDDLQHDPVTYFCRDTGVGQALTRRPGGPPWRVGIVGLGAGTLAAYGQPGDTFRFYEINPLVEEVARHWFTYLKESRAKIEVALGDGRLSLEREPPQNFDLLVLDAFAGDSIPVHLLTREAFIGYFRHLKPNGILAVQATNNYVDLASMLGAAAADFGKTAQLVEDDGDGYGVCFPNSWVIVAMSGHPLDLRRGKTLKPSTGIRAWTDDYSNLLRILK